jgi:stalled ribosome alternative rescue factor ArfA
MKPIHFTIQAPKERRHRALFDQDLPFRGRVERPKTEYQRRPKHKNREQQE